MVRVRVARVLLVLSVAMLSSCSMKRTVAGLLGDALSGGSGVFASEEDPQLIREALPFALKTYESLLATTPEHQGLLLATARGFAGYAFLLQREADTLEEEALPKSRKLKARAKRLFLRGRDHALRGLEVRHRGFIAGFRKHPKTALAAMEKEDAPFLYWAGAAWAGALDAAKDDLTLIAELPLAGALVERSLMVDETFGGGAAHEFFISFEAGRPGGSAAKARGHYRKALELSQGLRVSVHLALAEAVSVRAQNLKEFRALLAKVKEMDLERAPNLRLVNAIARERAEWLEKRIPALFLDAE